MILAPGAFRLMGIVNVTPDSFSDGGRFLQPGAAIEHSLRLIGEGADILDVGGESTRPGAEPVAAASASLQAGASLVNDVSAFRADPQMAAVVADSDAECCLMHMLGEPRTMQQDPRYEDVLDEVKAFLEQRLAFAVSEGVSERRVLLDPGIGFGKTVEHNLELLRRLDELSSLGRPLVIGTSRKSFLAAIAGGGEGGPAARLAGTVASNVLALERGASVFRVHDVAPVREALAVAAATLGERWTARSTETTPTR